MSDVALDLLAEIERLRKELDYLNNQRRLDNGDLARAYDEGRDNERAAVVAALRRTSNHGPMGLSLVNLDSIADAIENGDHRRVEG
jgi:hypothetical protein